MDFQIQLRRVPADGDVIDLGRRVVRHQRRPDRRQDEHAGRGLRREGPRGGRDRVGCLVPVEAELPEAEPTRAQRELLVVAAPLRAPELERVALVGTEEPEAQAVELEALAHVPVFLELLRALPLGVVEVEPDAGLDLALDVHAAERELGPGRARAPEDQHRCQDQANGCRRSHGAAPIS